MKLFCNLYKAKLLLTHSLITKTTDYNEIWNIPSFWVLVLTNEVFENFGLSG